MAEEREHQEQGSPAGAPRDSTRDGRRERRPDRGRGKTVLTPRGYSLYL
ncbi:MAG: hypothetical protein KatS3mg102_1945 [Planctomycetota bacterium]|nr:MAG: hypothetical protein KatS3mg102_1945 [Planctomycetota bacterium]